MEPNYRCWVDYEGMMYAYTYEWIKAIAANGGVDPSDIEAYIPGVGWTTKFDKPKTEPTGTEAKVCEDIAERQRAGIAKYKTTVADNPLSLREWLTHAYQECLDQAVYLRRAIEEMDKDGKPTNCELCGNLRKSGAKTHNVDLG
jgi:hypothetical protein